jgi:hypothetical protein
MQGTREFFETQGMDVLAELMRREGADTLTQGIQGTGSVYGLPGACAAGGV